MIDELILICIFVFITGACIGSFLNVVALRAISKESIVFPASKCPVCNEPIKWYDNIPILSYILTFRGKCRNCGCKVSLQYPIVEAITAILFLAVFLAFGVSIKTLLLLILLCVSIVITITDLKEHSTYDVHLWILIIMSLVSSLYFRGLQNYSIPLIGLLTGVVVMEVIARAGYYLISKEDEDENEEENTSFMEKLSYPVIALLSVGLAFVGYVMYGINSPFYLVCILYLASILLCLFSVKKENALAVFAVLLGLDSIVVSFCSFLNNYTNQYLSLVLCTVIGIGIIKLFTKYADSVMEKFPVNGNAEEVHEEIVQDEELKEYVEENKRAFGEGDTYLAAASGALLGAVGFFVAIFISILLQAVCILPQYIKSLFTGKKQRLLLIYSLIIAVTVILLTLPKLFELDEFETYSIAACAVLLVLSMISVLKKTTNEQTYIAIPFGPAMLIATFLTLFFGKYITDMLFVIYSHIGA